MGYAVGNSAVTIYPDLYVERLYVPAVFFSYFRPELTASFYG